MPQRRGHGPVPVRSATVPPAPTLHRAGNAPGPRSRRASRRPDRYGTVPAAGRFPVERPGHEWRPVHWRSPATRPVPPAYRLIGEIRIGVVAEGTEPWNPQYRAGAANPYMGMDQPLRTHRFEIVRPYGRKPVHLTEGAKQGRHVGAACVPFLGGCCLSALYHSAAESAADRGHMSTWRPAISARVPQLYRLAPQTKLPGFRGIRVRH